MSVRVAIVWRVTVWSPGRRKNQLALETPYEGVPEHLRQPLWSWLEPVLEGNSHFVVGAGLELRVALPDMVAYGAESGVSRLREVIAADPGLFLDLIEYVLERKDFDDTRLLHDDGVRHHGVGKLELLLELGNSAYKVREDATGLEMRTLPAVQQQVQGVVDTAGAAGAHLADAWNAAYSRTPDPVKSYYESVKAVEAALASKISPNNSKATLGSMIADLKNKPEKWKFVIPDGTRSKGVETLLGMMQVLWQRNARHGGPDHKPETLEEAQAAVHLAASLVQFGVSGAFDFA